LRGHEQQGGASEHRRREAKQLPSQRVVVLGSRGEPEDRQVQDAHREVGEGKHDGTAQAAVDVVEGLRNRERHHEHRCHGTEHRDAADAFVCLHDVPEPGVADPAPPEQGEHEQTAKHAADRDVVGHQRRDLRQREDED
jgi:hypothetical protein